MWFVWHNIECSVVDGDEYVYWQEGWSIDERREFDAELMRVRGLVCVGECVGGRRSERGEKGPMEGCPHGERAPRLGRLGSRVGGRLESMPKAASALPSLQVRTTRLQKLQATHPRVVKTYCASCWAYTAVGMWYLIIMPKMPKPFHTTFLMPGYLFGLLLILQGAASYMNDAVATLGFPTTMGRHFWTIADRCLAWALTINTVGTALFTWPHAGDADSRRLVSLALIFSICITYPTSKTLECAPPPLIFEKV